jgi:MYXO-CTERM domain-containing protein
MLAPVAHPSAAPSHRRELHRIRRHLRRAEVAARRAPDADLDPLRRMVRALLLDELAAYRARGLFPRNHVVRGLHPVFVDEVGTRCAVAHLLDASGQSALVDDIASRRNLAYVDELADEPALVAWLHAAGLTLAEAAAIQPGYTFVPSSCVCGTESFGARPPYGTPATAVLDIQALESTSTYGPVPGVVVAIDGTTSQYAVGQAVRVLVPSELVAQGALILAPVGGPTEGFRFNIPDAGHGSPMDAAADAAPPPPPVDAGGPLLGGYVLHAGAILCPGAIGPLTRAQFTNAVKAPVCTAALASIDPRWTEARYEGLETGCSCSVQGGSVGASGTLALLLALLATRRRRRP